MQFSTKIMARAPFNNSRAFSLVEMLVVIAVVSLLMTAAAVGINGMGGKGVTSAVSSAEAIFDEARATAKARSIRTCVLVARDLTNNPQDNLRRVIVAHELVDEETGEPARLPGEEPTWVISSRGALLPEKIYFSQRLSRLDTGEEVPSITDSRLHNPKESFMGSYFVYEFNSEGICSEPGISFVLGSGARTQNRSATEAPPRVTGSAKRDFGGFVVWRNGGTSLFRKPTQIARASEFPKVGEDF